MKLWGFHMLCRRNDEKIRHSWWKLISPRPPVSNLPCSGACPVLLLWVWIWLCPSVPSLGSSRLPMEKPAPIFSPMNMAALCSPLSEAQGQVWGWLQVISEVISGFKLKMQRLKLMYKFLQRNNKLFRSGWQGFYFPTGEDRALLHTQSLTYLLVLHKHLMIKSIQVRKSLLLAICDFHFSKHI